MKNSIEIPDPEGLYEVEFQQDTAKLEYVSRIIGVALTAKGLPGEFEIFNSSNENEVTSITDILLFDIIYCSHVYNLFDGITFARPKSKEKQLIIEQKNKAKTLKDAYEEAKQKADYLNEALRYFTETIKEAGIVKHKAYGNCDVLYVDSKYIKLRIQKTGEAKQLGLAIVIANGIISVDVPDFSEKKSEYIDVLKKADSIPRNLEYASRALEPYKEYLD